MSQEEIALSLTKNEALVSFEFLARFNKKEGMDSFEDQAEQRVLWDLESMLEKQLSDPLRSDYRLIIQRAREPIRDKT